MASCHCTPGFTSPPFHTTVRVSCGAGSLPSPCRTALWAWLARLAALEWTSTRYLHLTVLHRTLKEGIPLETAAPPHPLLEDSPIDGDKGSGTLTERQGHGHIHHSSLEWVKVGFWHTQACPEVPQSLHGCSQIFRESQFSTLQFAELSLALDLRLEGKETADQGLRHTAPSHPAPIHLQRMSVSLQVYTKFINYITRNGRTLLDYCEIRRRSADVPTKSCGFRLAD